MAIPSLRRGIIRHRLSASTSYVLASLRALHVDPSFGDDGFCDEGGKGNGCRQVPEHRRCRTDPRVNYADRALPGGAPSVRGTYLRIADLRFRPANIRVVVPRSTPLRHLSTQSAWGVAPRQNPPTQLERSGLTGRSTSVPQDSRARRSAASTAAAGFSA